MCERMKDKIENLAPKPQFGALKGSVGPEFFEPLPDDELALWNCEADEPLTTASADCGDRSSA